MRTIIAGSRNIQNPSLHLKQALFSCKFKDKIKEIVSGGARGVDKAGEDFARSSHIKLKIFPADWKRYGKKAGYIRNCEMADYADSLIAIWDKRSRGTRMMIDIAIKKGLTISVYEVD